MRVLSIPKIGFIAAQTFLPSSAFLTAAAMSRTTSGFNPSSPKFWSERLFLP
jgi:hypothetical protein